MEDEVWYYAIIPANVRYANIKANAKLLYWEITALAKRTGECYANNKYFADLYNVSEKQISVWIKELYDHWFIIVRVDQKLGNKRFIGIHQKVMTYPPKGYDPTHQKVWYNNTVNNTLNNKDNKKEKKILSLEEFMEKIKPVIVIRKTEWYKEKDLLDQWKICWLHHEEKKGIKTATTAYNNWITNQISWNKISKPKRTQDIEID